MILNMFPVIYIYNTTFKLNTPRMLTLVEDARPRNMFGFVLCHVHALPSAILWFAWFMLFIRSSAFCVLWHLPFLFVFWIANILSYSSCFVFSLLEWHVLSRCSTEFRSLVWISDVRIWPPGVNWWREFDFEADDTQLLSSRPQETRKRLTYEN